jgi:small-conductance mechanosensitive channel/CRP-like cAMP-binding protein
MASQRKLSAATIAALAVVGISLLGIWLARPLESLFEIAETEAGTTWLRQVFSTLFVLAGAQLVNRLIDAVIWDRLVSRALGGKVPAILKTMVSMVVFLIGISIIVGVVFDQSVAGFLAALGAGGVVLGLAVRGIFSDLFSGLAINCDRNVVLGDWVQVPAASPPITGKVREIGWRSSMLETEDGTVVIVPNTTLAEGIVTNYSRPSLATRYQCTMELDPRVPCDRAKRILLGGVRSLAGTAGFTDRSPVVLVNTTTERGIEYLIRYWIEPWNPLSPASARDAVMTRVLQHMAVAGLAPAIEKTEVFYERLPEREDVDATTETRAALLSRTALFASLEASDRLALAGDLRRLMLPSNTLVIAQGDEGDTLYVIAEGTLDVLVRPKPTDDPMRVASLGPGDFFGEMSLLTGEPRRADVRTATPVLIYELARETVAQLIEQRPVIADRLARAVSERKIALESIHSPVSIPAKEEAVAGLTGQLSRMMRQFFSRQPERAPA